MSKRKAVDALEPTSSSCPRENAHRLNKALYEACERGDLEEARNLITAGGLNINWAYNVS